MSIIDVDAHFEPGDAWLDDLPELRDRMPSFPYEDRIIAFVCGDLLRDVPPDAWPATDDLVPPGIRAIMGKEKVEGFEDAVQHPVADAPRTGGMARPSRDRRAERHLRRGHYMGPVP